MRNKVALLLSITGILVLGLIGWQLYKISTFHIVSTTPKLSAVSRISPYVKINFNDVLFEDGLKISDPAGIISGKSIKDKTLTLNFTNELKVDQEYTITLDSISNIGGE